MTQLRSGVATDVGRVRSDNQDSALERTGLFAVADGMGGHAGGEVASQIAVETLGSVFGEEASLSGLRRAVEAANAAIWHRSQTEPDLHGMGTTLTAAAVIHGDRGNESIALANVGDSRAYLFSNGQVTQITEDHSLAEEKVRLGELTEAEASVHPQRHILTRALGISAYVDVDLWELNLLGGDRLILCSDGLTNEVPDELMATVLASIDDPQAAASELVALANRRGGADNITVVIVDVLDGADDAHTSPANLDAGPLFAAAEVVPSPTLTVPSTPVESIPPVPALPPRSALSDAPTAAPMTTTLLAPKLTWREQRLRAGRRRLVSIWTLLFVVALAIIVAGGYVFIRWYAKDEYYVTTNAQHELVIYQGHPGGTLWFHPKLVERTSERLGQVEPGYRADVKGDVTEPTLGAARRYVRNIKAKPSPVITTTTTTAAATTTTAGGF